MDKTNCSNKRGRKFKGDKVEYPENIKYKDLLEDSDQKAVAKACRITHFHLNKILNGHKKLQPYQKEIIERFGEVNKMKQSIAAPAPLFDQAQVQV